MEPFALDHLRDYHGQEVLAVQLLPPLPKVGLQRCALPSLVFDHGQWDVGSESIPGAVDGGIERNRHDIRGTQGPDVTHRPRRGRVDTCHKDDYVLVHRATVDGNTGLVG